MLVRIISRGAEWKEDSLKNDVMALEGKEEEVAYTANTQDCKRLVDYCIEKRYQSVIIMTPVTENLKIELTYQLIEEFYQMTEEMLSEYKDIPVLDYSRDENFTKNLEYHKDADHLNAYGKEAYTKKVLEDLAQLNLINKIQILD
ncbi:MAG: hypothetical protein HFE75_16495 [Firmicutes bacterium]|nr:hypothetical protein [Bacillota bacterium]